MKKQLIFVILMMFGLVFDVWAGKNLIENGDFEDPENPFKGWTIDFDWMENKNFMNNTQSVVFVKQDGSKKNVLQLIKAGREPIFMSPLVPFEYGKRYRVSFDFRSKMGYKCRVYIRGFKWKSGMRPYANPHPGDLQLIYRGPALNCKGGVVKDTGSGDVLSETSKSWQRVTTTFPFSDYKDLTSGAQSALKQVRFFGLYCTIPELPEREIGPEGEAFLIDNLVIEEI